MPDETCLAVSAQRMGRPCCCTHVSSGHLAAACSQHLARQLGHVSWGSLPVELAAAARHRRGQQACVTGHHTLSMHIAPECPQSAAPRCLPDCRYERLVKIMEKYDLDQSGEQPTDWLTQAAG